MTKEGQREFKMTAAERNYSQVHSWLRKMFGKASKCEAEGCLHTKAKRFEWALRKGFLYEKKRENFIQMCCSCHRKYDLTEETRLKISVAQKKSSTFVTRNPMKTEDGKRKASEWMKRRFVSDKTREKRSLSQKGQMPAYMKIGIKLDHSGDKNPCAKKVIDTSTRIIYGTVKEAAQQLGINRTYLSQVLKGKEKSRKITTLKYYDNQ